MTELVSAQDEKKLLKKFIDYYRKLYPEIGFGTEQRDLGREEIGEIIYTYPGVEIEATADLKTRRISTALKHGYSTPIIVMAKAGKMILLDGHRRVRVAFHNGLGWKAYFIIPEKEEAFGIEKMAKGKVKDLFGKQ